jgi:hypothetical protein
VRLTDEQRIAAALMGMFAAIRFDDDCDGRYGWYGWCVTEAEATSDRLVGAVWWALRCEADGMPSDDWLAYVEAVYRTRRP